MALLHNAAPAILEKSNELEKLSNVSVEINI